jgi:hypothetical protein
MLAVTENFQEDRAMIVVNLVNDLQPMWQNIAESYCRLCLSQRDESQSKDWQELDRQVESLENFFYAWVKEYREVYSAEALKAIIAAVYGDDIFESIFETYGPRSQLAAGFIQRYPSVKYFSDTVIT